MSIEDQHVFAIAPLEMARDRRLGAPHLRVLLALLSFRNKEDNLVWTSRKRLSDITGYTIQNISRYTRELVGLGWLEKDGNGGRSQSVRYRITVPDIGAEDGETVTEQVTVSRLSHPVDNRETYTETVSQQDTSIEQTIDTTKNRQGMVVT